MEGFVGYAIDGDFAGMVICRAGRLPKIGKSRTYMETTYDGYPQIPDVAVAPQARLPLVQGKVWAYWQLSGMTPAIIKLKFYLILSREQIIQ